MTLIFTASSGRLTLLLLTFCFSLNIDNIKFILFGYIDSVFQLYTFDLIEAKAYLIFF